MATYSIVKMTSPEGDVYNLIDSTAIHGIATVLNVGGVKAGGSGIVIDNDGTINAYAAIDSTYNSNTKTVTLLVSMLNDADNTGTATIVLHEEQYKEAYQPGKHLYINVILNQMDIALKAAIYPWVTEDPVEMEGIEE